MRAALFVALLLLCGCDGDNIRTCGYSCEQGGNAMLSYSKADGCKCGGPVKP